MMQKMIASPEQHKQADLSAFQSSHLIFKTIAYAVPLFRDTLNIQRIVATIDIMVQILRIQKPCITSRYPYNALRNNGRRMISL